MKINCRTELAIENGLRSAKEKYKKAEKENNLEEIQEALKELEYFTKRMKELGKEIK